MQRQARERRVTQLKRTRSSSRVPNCPRVSCCVHGLCIVYSFIVTCTETYTDATPSCASPTLLSYCNVQFWPGLMRADDCGPASTSASRSTNGPDISGTEDSLSVPAPKLSALSCNEDKLAFNRWEDKHDEMEDFPPTAACSTTAHAEGVN